MKTTIGNATLHLGDSRDVLACLPENSVDSVVTDPPYSLTSIQKRFGGPNAAPAQYGKDGAFRRVSGGFMNCKWDSTGIERDPAFWAEVLRVLKPGGHLLAFGGSRTFHRMASAVEDAGFEIRDAIMWLHSQGFPKNHDLGNGWGTSLKPAFENVTLAQKPEDMTFLHAEMAAFLSQMEARLWSVLPVNNAAESFGLSPHDYSEACASAQWSAAERDSIRVGLCGQMATSQFVSVMTTCLNIVQSWRRILEGLCEETNTFTIATELSLTTDLKTLKSFLSPTTPACIVEAATSPDGSALRALPVIRCFNAFACKWNSIRELSALGNASVQGQAKCTVIEPICLARKPFRGSARANVEQWGTGGLNIEACRVGTRADAPQTQGAYRGSSVDIVPEREGGKVYTEGRWPSNTLLSCCDRAEGEPPCAGCPVAELDAQSGVSSSKRMERGEVEIFKKPNSWIGQSTVRGHDDSGGASRFFFTALETIEERLARQAPFIYQAKPSSAERNRGCEELPEKRGGSETFDPRTRAGTGEERMPLTRNAHPTVKSVSLMRYLCRLITPPGGTVLDPFMGSGSTGVAAAREGFHFIGIEKEAEYHAICCKRLTDAANLVGLFADGEEGE